MRYTIISFYKYTPVENPALLCEELRSWCQALGIKGRILVSEEGVNGAVCGKKEDIINFKQRLKELSFFHDLTFREQEYQQNTYHKLVVKVRKEIVVFGEKVNFSSLGTPLPPSELKRWYDEKKDFVMVDVRNDYEFDVGRFNGGVKMPIRNFRNFSQFVSLLEPYRNKTIVTYCTGGIRCEKASAYLKEQGFNDVYQLQEGIINYVNEFPATYWEGGLFVFDDRRVSKLENPISACVLCKELTDEYINCYNLDCDKLFICCEKCQGVMNKTCSDYCKNSKRQREEKKKFQVIGRVENYYKKAKIALVRLETEINKGMPVFFKGKTTLLFIENVSEFREVEQNLITMPVSQKVRKNDLVLIE